MSVFTQPGITHSNSGIVDHRIQFAEFGLDPLSRFRYRIVTGNIQFQSHGSMPDFLCCPLTGILRTDSQNNLVAAFSKLAGNFTTDTSIGTSNQNNS